MDFRAASGIARTVFEQVAEDGVDERIVSVKRHLLGQFHHHPHFRLLEQFVQVLLHPADQLCYVHRFARHEFRRLLRFRDQRHVAYQVGQAHHLRQCLFEEIMLPFLSQSRAVQDSFEIAPHAAHWCAQFVRDVVAHLLLQQAGLLSRRDVRQCEFKSPVAVHQQLYGKGRAARPERIAENRCFLRHGPAAAV